MSTSQNVATTTCDGIICIGGEDWWYHNRGHYDMQMMREFSGDVPVLYVNSIGMRVPAVSEGRMFFSRVRRKLKSIRRGLVQVRPGFSVMSVLAAPGSIGRGIQSICMPLQINRAARSLGITKPLVWVACPPGEKVLKKLNPAAVVYQRTDRFEAFPNVDVEEIIRCDKSLRKTAHLVLYCSRHLFNQERDESPHTAFVDHGVDFDRFVKAGNSTGDCPSDMMDIPSPVVGFIGGIDAHTFDPKRFTEIVASLPDVNFVLIGACSLPDDWCPYSNVRFLGQKNYDDVPAYMAACNALIMVWNDSDWIKACNPVKLKEYLATGRPVVSTGFDELEHWSDFVRVADDPIDFATAIVQVLSEDYDPALQRERVSAETWSAKASQVMLSLNEVGITFKP